MNEVPTDAPKKPVMSPRVLTALVGIPIVLGIVYFGGWLLVGVAFLLALLSMNELISATKQSNSRIELLSFGVLVPLFVSLLSNSSLWPNQNARANSQLLISALVIAVLCAAIFQFNAARKITLQSSALSVFAALYVSLFAFIPLLQSQTNGRALLWLAIFGVWTGDTIAYYAGRRFGRTKLTPLSPGKSREGWLAGIVATVLVSMLIAHFAHLGIARGVVLGICVGVFAPLGDLAESFWKRELGVKDLGTILPGHGGVLDRCDSLLFAVPVVYFAAKVLRACLHN